MGLFDFLKKKPVDSAAVSTAAPQKIQVSLEKSNENLGKVLVNLSKNCSVDLSKHTARVAMAMDFSGSMDRLYYNGEVQDIITRLLPIALRFDDNGELESWMFSNECKRIEPVTKSNYENYVGNVMLTSSLRMAGTNYSPCLKSIVKLYQKKEPSTIPAFVIFITDGECFDSDKKETDQIIRELSNYNIFVQFVGIGRENFNYLRKLDDLSGRTHDNTGFIKVSDIAEMTDDELYTNLLSQYKDWLNMR